MLTPKRVLAAAILLVLGLGPAAAEQGTADFSGDASIGSQVSGHFWNTDHSLAITGDPDHVLAVTQYRPDPHPEKGIWDHLRTLDFDFGSPSLFGSPEDVARWKAEADLLAANGIPAVQIGKVGAIDGHPAMVIPRYTGLAAVGADGREEAQRFINYADPERTRASLEALETGLRRLRSQGVDVSIGGLAIQPDGSVFLMKPKGKIVQGSASDGLGAAPLTPGAKQAADANDARALEPIRRELALVKKVATILDEQNVATDSTTSRRQAAAILAGIAERTAAGSPLSDYDVPQMGSAVTSRREKDVVGELQRVLVDASDATFRNLPTNLVIDALRGSFDPDDGVAQGPRTGITAKVGGLTTAR